MEVDEEPVPQTKMKDYIVEEVKTQVTKLKREMQKTCQVEVMAKLLCLHRHLDNNLPKIQKRKNKKIHENIVLIK